MQSPLQITFRDIEPSDFIQSTIRERAARLERFNGQITRCHVVVGMPHRHHRKGQHFSVRIDITTPGGTLTVARDPHEDTAREDFNVVIRDAFDAATRRLEDDTRRRATR